MRKNLPIRFTKPRKKEYEHFAQPCPMCNSPKSFIYSYYTEECYGIVEQHGRCHKCGFLVEQAYSPVICGFLDTKKGFKDHMGIYHAKDYKKHKRMRRKCNITGKEYEINKPWMRCFLRQIIDSYHRYKELTENSRRSY